MSFKERPSNYPRDLFQEIITSLDLPNTQTEQQLRENFFTQFKDQVVNIISIRTPEVSLSDNQIEKITAYLYGIYFYNLISNNAILNHKSYFFRRRNSQDLAVTENLSLWPLWITESFSTQAKASAIRGKNLIRLTLNQFTDSSPTKIVRRNILKPFIGIIGKSISYPSDEILEWILIGIEESTHLHEFYLEEEYIKSGIPYTPIPDYADLDQIPRGNGRELQYYSLIGSEYLAHQTQALFVEKYFPETWSNGFKEYADLIKKIREKASQKKRLKK